MTPGTARVNPVSLPESQSPVKPAPKMASPSPDTKTSQAKQTLPGSKQPPIVSTGQEKKPTLSRANAPHRFAGRTKPVPPPPVKKPSFLRGLISAGEAMLTGDMVGATEHLISAVLGEVPVEKVLKTGIKTSVLGTVAYAGTRAAGAKVSPAMLASIVKNAAGQLQTVATAAAKKITLNPLTIADGIHTAAKAIIEKTTEGLQWAASANQRFCEAELKKLSAAHAQHYGLIQSFRWFFRPLKKGPKLPDQSIISALRCGDLEKIRQPGLLESVSKLSVVKYPAHVLRLGTWGAAAAAVGVGAKRFFFGFGREFGLSGEALRLSNSANEAAQHLDRISATVASFSAKAAQTLDVFKAKKVIKSIADITKSIANQKGLKNTLRDPVRLKRQALEAVKASGKAALQLLNEDKARLYYVEQWRKLLKSSIIPDLKLKQLEFDNTRAKTVSDIAQIRMDFKKTVKTLWQNIRSQLLAERAFKIQQQSLAELRAAAAPLVKKQEAINWFKQVGALGVIKHSVVKLATKIGGKANKALENGMEAFANWVMQRRTQS
ncbi:MAG: hypothetical protein AAGI66_04380 [Cyanobacteria bacterium P01_H01_bin.74]